MSADEFLNSEDTKPVKPTRKRRASKNTTKKAVEPTPEVVEEKVVENEVVEPAPEVVEAVEVVEEKVVVNAPDEAYIMNFLYDELNTSSDKVLNYSGKMYRMFFGRVGRSSKDINFKPVNHIMAPNNSYIVDVTNDGLSVGDQITCPLLGVTPEDVTYTGKNYIILNNGPNRVSLEPGKPILHLKD